MTDVLPSKKRAQSTNPHYELSDLQDLYDDLDSNS